MLTKLNCQFQIYNPSRVLLRDCESYFEALISTYGVVEHRADLGVVGDELVHEDHLAVVVVEGADLSEEQTK